MSLPVVGYREIIKALRKIGFYPVRQNGSHIILENGKGSWTVVPRKKELGKGLLLQIISECGLTKKRVFGFTLTCKTSCKQDTLHLHQSCRGLIRFLRRCDAVRGGVGWGFCSWIISCGLYADVEPPL